jgi:hypothetical protein
MASAEKGLALTAHGNLHACRHDVTHRLWTLRNQVLKQRAIIGSFVVMLEVPLGRRPSRQRE